jgi:poly-beta-1,6-N-acetyl-D-glucosamine synthase
LLLACAVLFCLSAGLILYVYAGFPLCLFLLTRGRRATAPPDLPDDELPSVSMLVAAYNEERVIETKLRNCLAIDYPASKLRFIFVSDSTDGTNEILARYQSPRIRVLTLPERRGKLNALAAGRQLCDSEIVVFSDANTYYRPDAIRKLVRHFRDPQIGTVTGDVRILPSNQPFGTGEALYYKYERWLQELETSFWSTVGIDGAMYAMRLSDLQLPTSHLVTDDFVTGMNVGLRGKRIIYDPEAIAEEPPTPTDEDEFGRKVRVVAHTFQSFLRNQGVPGINHPRLWWIYVSHKLLRWLVPVFAAAALLSNLGAAALSAPWSLLLALQVLFYLLGLVAWRVPTLNSKCFRVPYYFLLVNLAALVGLWRAIRFKQRAVWEKVERLAQ